MSTTRSSRGNPSMGDILRSMLVIAAIVLALWGVGKLFTSEPDTPVEPIDVATVSAQARAAATFDLVAPATLPKGWRGTSARFEPDSWHLGVLTAGDDYLGLEQVKVSVDRAVDLFAEGSRRGGTAVVDGATWTVRTGPNGRLTYVRREGGLTTLIIGTTSRPVLERYIASLV